MDEEQERSLTVFVKIADASITSADLNTERDNKEANTVRQTLAFEMISEFANCKMDIDFQCINEPSGCIFIQFCQLPLC